MRRIDALNNPVVWIVGGALIASWFYGVFHTYKAHQGIPAVAAILFPPYGLYMAAEQSFGHAASSGEAFSLPVAEMIEKNAAVCQKSEDWQQQLGLNDEQFSVFCTCVWKFVIDNFPADENEYVDKYGKNSPRLSQVKTRATDTCLATSEYSDTPMEG
jgi:hypothetical protein